MVRALGSKWSGAVELREVYREVAHNIIGSESIDLQYGVCPDQCVGRIGDFDGNADDFPLREPATRLVNHPCVVLIMESPHIDEFIGDWGPAKGKTGVQIRKHIAAIVADLEGPLSDLILVNAIQYQCSLGMPTHRYRNRVFRGFWENGGAENFANRLKRLYRPGDMLINGCTGGDAHSGLRQLVTKAIRSSLEAVPLHSGPHPVSWFSKQNRRAIHLIDAQ